jgi:hypothetical protein
MTRTLAFAGAKGGQGTTTIAAATAVLAAGHAPTTLVTPEPRDAATLLGLSGPADGGPVQITPTLWLSSEPVEDTALTVVDGPDLRDADERYLVLRGPCYLALAAALRHDSPPDGIVLLQEPGRSLTARDVTEVTGIPVVAQVAVSDVVARAIDAGLLLARLHHLADLRPLRTLATPPTARPLRTTAAPFRQTPTTRSTTGTDLAPPQSGSGGDGDTRVRTRREPHVSMHVGRSWRRSDRRTAPDVEHREARARRRGLLHRRGRDLGRGLLHRPR